VPNPIKTILRQTAEADGFRYVVERRHLNEAADYIELLETRIHAIRTALEEIVVPDGIDAGVILLSDASPTKYDPEAKCQVYLHENFSPLGDALVALHKLCVPE